MEKKENKMWIGSSINQSMQSNQSSKQGQLEGRPILFGFDPSVLIFFLFARMPNKYVAVDKK